MRTILLFLFIAAGVKAQITFEKSYQARLNAVALIADSGYLIGGSVYDTNNSQRDIYFVRANLYGDTIWTKKDSTDSKEHISCILPAGNEQFLLAGYRDLSIYLLKIKLNGDTIWTKLFNNQEYGLSDIDTVRDGGFILTGRYNDWYMGLYKLDENGDSVWAKSYGWSLSQDISYSVETCADSGYIMVGSALDILEMQIYTVKTNYWGDTVWTKKYNPLKFLNEGFSIQQCQDGGYIISGYVGPVIDRTSSLLFKVNSAGDSLWLKVFGDSTKVNHGMSVKQTKDGGFILLVNSYVVNFLQGDSGNVSLIKTDSVGNTIWQRVFGRNDVPEYANDGSGILQLTPDGGYAFVANSHFIKTDSLGCVYPRANIVFNDTVVYRNAPINFYDSTFVWYSPIISWRWDWGDGFTDTVQNPAHIYSDTGIYTVKLTVTNRPGCTDSVTKNITVIDSLTGMPVITSAKPFISITPNPFSNSATVRIDKQEMKNCELRVYDLLGREVYQIALNNQSARFSCWGLFLSGNWQPASNSKRQVDKAIKWNG